MRNAEFLARILSSHSTYWCICFRYDGAMSHEFITVALVAMPPSVQFTKEEDIKFNDLKTLRTLDLPNVFLSENYPPFQFSINLYNAHDGFPIECNVKSFLKDAINAEPKKDLYYYKQIHKSLLDDETPL
jgi:hypothetical protein